MDRFDAPFRAGGQQLGYEPLDMPAYSGPTPAGANAQYIANPYLVDEKRRLVPQIKIVRIGHNTI
jgi:hypothetical protein